MRIKLFLMLLTMGLFTACGKSDKTSGQSTETTTTAPAAPQSKYAYVEQYIGKRPAEVNLLATEPLQTDLRMLLGSEYNNFAEAMLEAMPIQKDRVIYTMGTIPDDAIRGMAYLLIDTENDKLKAYYLVGDQESSFQSPGEAIYLPPAVQDMLMQVKGN